MPGYVGFCVVGVCWVVEDFVEDAVCAPGRAGADEFAVCGAECEKHGVVEFFVVGYEVEFIRVDYVKFWSAYGFRVVWISFYSAVVGERDAGFLGFPVGGFREFSQKTVYVFDYEFCLSPAWTDYAYVCVRICQCVVQKQGAYGVAFPCLSCPSCGYELAVLELVYEFCLVACGCEA